MRVLIVEDEKSLAAEIRSALEKNHFTCEITGTAQGALHELDKGSFDFILLDIGLPDKDGFWLLDEIRKDYKDVAVIILTAR